MRLAGSPISSLVLLQPWPASLPIGHFLGVPYVCRKCNLFLFFFFELFYLRGLDSLAHDISLHFLVPEALKFLGKRKNLSFLAYWQV